MKILFLIESLTKGGAERVLVNTLPELQNLNIECEVATLFVGDDLIEEMENKGIKVHKLRLSYKWNFFEGLFKLNHLIRRNHYDIIHAHLFFAYFYTGILKFFYPSIKTLTTFHNLGFDEYPANSVTKKIRKKIDRFIVTQSFDRITAVSTAVKNHYQMHFYLDNVDVLFNSFPIDDFDQYFKQDSSNLLEKYIPGNSNKFVVLTPGRFVEKKGHKYLLEAVCLLNIKYSDIVFLCIGRGPLENHLKEHSPDNIKFLPEMLHSELMRIYNEVDLVVVPSVYEAFGLVVGEAMIMKKGIIATEVDGIIEMVTNEKHGLLVPRSDALALALAIERLYIDPKLRDLLAANAKEKIKLFDVKSIAMQWQAYYQDMLLDKSTKNIE